MIRNPVLPGFSPDPSICRVGDNDHIATSTFEWHPGVRSHGAFVGMFAFDQTGQGREARITHFTYRPEA